MAFPTSLARRAQPDLASTNANQSAQPTNHLSFSPNASTRSPPGEKPRFVGATAATRMLFHSSACRGSRLLSTRSSSGGSSQFPLSRFASSPLKTLGALRTLVVMSYRGGRGGGGPNSHRGRGRGGGGGRGGRGGGGGRGEQRWWDPEWRAERLRQMHGEVRTLSSPVPRRGDGIGCFVAMLPPC